MTNIFEKYEFIKEFERCVEFDDQTTFSTRMKAKQSGGEFYPLWMHRIDNDVDTNPQSNIDYLVSCEVA